MTRKDNNEKKILSCLESSGRIQFQGNSILTNIPSLPVWDPGGRVLRSQEYL